jgi:hypothetical protein
VDISIRSYLTAGMAAVVGATAIGLSPVPPAPALHAAGLPVQAVAEIALTGTSIPWETIATVVTALSNGGSLQDSVSALLDSVGAEFVTQAMPLVTAAAGDVVVYLGTALAELLSGPDAPQVDFAAIVEAATTAINTGNLPGAVQALSSALSAPLTQISQVLFTPEFQAFVTGKIGGVLGALPEILRAAVQTVIGIDLKPVIDALPGLLGGLLPAASTLTATPALSAAAEPAAVVGGLTAVRLADVADVPAVSVAPELSAPQDDSATNAPAGEAAPEVQAAPEVVPADAAPVVEVVEVVPAAEIAPSAVPAETVVPVPSSLTVAPEAAASADPGPAVGTRLAKPGPRGRAAAADSRAAAAERG